MPGAHTILLIVVTTAAFYLYTRPWIRIELVSLLLLVTLLLIFYLFPYDGAGRRLTEIEIFQSFGHPALIAICSLMILARGLTTTGAMEPVVRLLSRLWKLNRWLGFLCTLVIAGAASAFINDTPVLVLMLPLLLSLAERTHYPASKTLMPVNFAILAGGMLTSVGTSTNLLVLRIAEDLGMARMGLFDFTGTALVAFLLAIPYLWLVAPYLLPSTDRGSARSDRLYEARVAVAAENARLKGRKLADLARTLGRPLPALALLRAGQQLPADPGTELLDGDALLLSDTPEGLREFASAFNVDLFERAGTEQVAAKTPRADARLAEIVVGNASDLNGRTLRESGFAEHHEVAVVGLSSGTGLLHRTTDIVDTPLSAGDILLVQGDTERIDKLRGRRDLMLLDANLVLPHSPRAWVALLIMVTVLVTASTQLLPIHVASFLGVIAMIVTGCVRFEGIGSALSLQVVLLIASSVALGQSLVATGAAGWAAQGIAAVVQYLPPAAQLAVFMGFAALLTNFVSNAATAAVGTPIAVATANQLGLPLEPFVLAILFGANLSYATPMAYQTNLIVMNAAGYRFSDFVKVGAPLVALMLTVLSFLLAKRYGL
ncbi:MAG TPA: SLC13 family permease [Gammaproteobacteria bacterium]|jgi:di/tricarboxylate transporter|nr:SLC13 family permease [Gammaproteobacteria bacterium]